MALESENYQRSLQGKSLLSAFQRFDSCFSHDQKLTAVDFHDVGCILSSNLEFRLFQNQISKNIVRLDPTRYLPMISQMVSPLTAQTMSKGIPARQI